MHTRTHIHTYDIYNMYTYMGRGHTTYSLTSLFFHSVLVSHLMSGTCVHTLVLEFGER